MGRFPFLFTDIEMIVARRTAPVDILRRLAGIEAAVLPEASAGAGAPPAVQAVDHVGGDAARFKHETRQRCGERSAFAIGTSDCCYFSTFVLVRFRPQPIRDFNFRITSGMVRPSARAENVSAMRCLRTGSARSSTSSIEGASRPSSKARGRNASINGWLARG